jgi:Raf kinase inhibitor-like YbhB/YbcL family protein
MRTAHSPKSRPPRTAFPFQNPACALAACLLLAAFALSACHSAQSRVSARVEASMELTSTSLKDARIPRQFTCDGADTSPQLAWTAPPAATKSLALLVTDPDAPSGTFTHWVLYNLPAATQSLPEGLPKQAQLSDGSRQGRNDFGRTGYGGPCPPPGTTHRYVFTLYALDATLPLPAGTTRAQVEEAMRSHILSMGHLTARYTR